jgi:hypothetical protein
MHHHDAPELQQIADTAAGVLRAEIDEHPQLDEQRAAEQAAIITAVRAGHPLTAISQAETRGQQATRDELRSELLKRITQTARRVQEATAQHHDAIRRADRAGLSAREIATHAQVAHATIRAITGRTSSQPLEPSTAIENTPDDNEAVIIENEADQRAAR